MEVIMKKYFENWKDATNFIVDFLRLNPKCFVQFEKDGCLCGMGSVVCGYDENLRKVFTGIVCLSCYKRAPIEDVYISPEW